MRTSTRRFVAPLLVALALAASGLPAAPPAVHAAGTVTALVIDSEAGDAIGQGQQLEYVPPASTFSVTTSNPGWTFVQVFAPTAATSGTVTSKAAGAEALAVGTYEDAQRLRGRHASGPRYRRPGPGLQHVHRTLRDRRDRARPGRERHSLAASFEQHCEGAPDRPLRRGPLPGERRLQAPGGRTGIGQPSARRGSVRRRLRRPVHLTSSGSAGVSLSALAITGPNAADFSIVSETCPVGVLAAVDLM